MRRRCSSRFGTANKPLAATFEVRRLLYSLEKHSATENGYENHVDQQGDREVSGVSELINELLERRLTVF